jgi:hypothetical protein
MDRTEAIEILKGIYGKVVTTVYGSGYEWKTAQRDVCSDAEKEAISMAISALKQAPTDYQYGRNVGIYKAVTDIEDAETVEAIPTAWIEAEIKKLRDLDFEFATMTAGQIEAMLNKWREERKG